MNREELEQLLVAYQPTDDLETEHLRRMLVLLRQTAAPFSRNQFEPGHFTASAFVLCPRKERLLLIFHDKLERWLQPGGHIDPEDTSILGAALRELREETGLRNHEVQAWPDQILDVDVHVIPPNPKKNEPSHRHFDIRILFFANTNLAEAGSDARDVQWVDIGDVDGVETDESVLRAVRKIRTILNE